MIGKEDNLIVADSIFKVNQRLEIWFMDKPDERYGTRIEEINSDSFVIAMPMCKGYPVMFPRNSNFSGKPIIEGLVYQFTCTLLGKRIHPLPIWIISLPFDIQKVQLRSFVRVAATLAIQLKIILPEAKKPNSAVAVNEPPVYSLLTRDISGGGVQVISKQLLKANAKVEIVLDIPANETMRVTVEIVRTQQPQPDIPVYWVSIKFTDIQEKDRSKIIKYIFKKQLEQRQKGV